jgi:AcrR family transcriptional regulator
MGGTEELPKDGRAARGFRARLAVADALLDLLTEGVEKPTAQQIAARAGVSLRLVFHHFADLEAIYASAADRQLQRIFALIHPIDPDLPFEQRLMAFLQERARVFEFVGPVRRAGLRLESTSPELSHRMRAAHQLARDLACRTFAQELARVGAEEHDEISHALDAVSSWEIWNFLRRREELSVKDTGSVMERLIRELF